MAFSNIITLLDEANAIAPPDPPSPIIIDNVGTFNSIQHSIDLAIASACPLSSDALAIPHHVFIIGVSDK